MKYKLEKGVIYDMLYTYSEPSSLEIVQDLIYDRVSPENIHYLLELDYIAYEQIELDDLLLISHMVSSFSYDSIYNYLLNNRYLSKSFTFFILQFIKKDVRNITELDKIIIPDKDVFIECVEVISDSIHNIYRDLIESIVWDNFKRGMLLVDTDDDIKEAFSKLDNNDFNSKEFRDIMNRYYLEIDSVHSHVESVFHGLKYNYLASTNPIFEDNMFIYLLKELRAVNSFMAFEYIGSKR